MSLLERNKSERRDRIVGAARRLIARGNIDRLTMRAVAEEAHVSVPTVYALVGGKDALIEMLLAEMVERVGARTAGAGGSDLVDLVERVGALADAAFDELAESPRSARKLIQLLLVRDELSALRQRIDMASMAMMTHVLEAGQRAGDIRPFVDIAALSASSYALHMAVLVRWSKGEMSIDSARAASKLGTTLMLAGVTDGALRQRLEALAVELQARAWK